LQLVRAQDGKATLDAVAAALGAKSTLTSLQFSAKGSNHAYGQAWRADIPWPAFKIFSYTATTDYATPAMRIDLQRTNPDITPVRGGGGLPLLAPQAQSQAVSGKLAWNLATPANGGAPVATPAPATVADRQLLLWTLTPQGVIKAAMANNASVAARVISFKVGDTQVRASLSPANLITSVRTTGVRPAWAIRSRRRRSATTRRCRGVKFPMHIVQKREVPDLDRRQRCGPSPTWRLMCHRPFSRPRRLRRLRYGSTHRKSPTAFTT
jgi:hypothetical protein